MHDCIHMGQIVKLKEKLMYRLYKMWICNSSLISSIFKDWNEFNLLSDLQIEAFRNVKLMQHIATNRICS